MEINSSFNSNDIEVILESSKIKKSFENVYAVKCGKLSLLKIFFFFSKRLIFLIFVFKLRGSQIMLK